MINTAQNTMGKAELVGLVLSFLYASVPLVLGQCPELTVPDHMNVPRTTGYGGDPPFEVTCHPGYKFDTDSSVKSIQCMTNNVWNVALGNCIPFECETPEQLGGAVEAYMGRFYQNRTEYNCISGHYIPVRKFVNGSSSITAIYSVTVVCNATAQWEPLDSTVQLSYQLCKDEMSFIGCLDQQSIIPVMTFNISNATAGNIIQECVETCRSSSPFAAIHGGTCFCGDLAAVQRNDSAACTLPCPDYNAMTKDSPVYCGGQFDQISAYSTLQGCYDDLDLYANNSTVNITVGDSMITCIELCRGQGFILAGYSRTGACLCDDGYLQTAVQESTRLDDFKCNFIPDVTTVFHLAMYELEAETCDDLFEKKIRTHAKYTLINPLRTEYCYFKDGTICDPDWVGSKGYCYYFLTPSSEVLDFTSAREFCREKDAELLSIMNAEELAFLNKTVFDFEKDGAYRPESCLPEDLVWWLGAVDSRQSGVYTWLDGNLLTYNIFSPGEPNVEQGLFASGTGGFACNSAIQSSYKKRVLCKKRSESVNCINSTDANANTVASFTRNSMTLSMCTEICKGQQTTFLLVRNNSCLCMNTLPHGSTNLTMKHCNQACPGDPYQFCGDTDANLYTVRKVDDLPSARSCKELQLLEIGEGNFLINNQVTSCGKLDCPYSFISIDGSSCYKFNSAYSYGIDTVRKCGQWDAYAVVIEDDKEFQDIVTSVSNIALYSGITEWRLGLTAVSTNYGHYRWANGRPNVDPKWSIAGANSGPYLAFNPGNSATWFGVQPNYYYYNPICERGAEYLGCWQTDVGPVIVDYDYMTIQLCVETCRVGGHKFALLGKASCACSSKELDVQFKSTGSCQESCTGQSNQLCGGTGNFLSVYNVSAYDEYTSCSELYDNGIFETGTYFLNGTNETCAFIDDSVPCDAQWTALQGNCYRHFRPDEAMTRYKICDSHNATQTSLLHVAEFDGLINFVQKIDFSGQTALPYTGITDGGYHMDVFQNQDGKLMSHELKTSRKLTVSDLNTGQQVISFRFNTSISGGLDGGVVCKKNTSVLGCFHFPYFAGDVYTLRAFDSIELTQCKQLCLEQDKNVTLIGKDFCLCKDVSFINGLTESSSEACNIPCQVQTYQKCGDGSVTWAHQTMEASDPMATSCQDLYSSGIFYNATYLLMDSGNGAIFRRQCGFSDDTECPPTWLGKESHCYKFNIQANTNGRSTCFLSDSFLFNPMHHDMTNTFVDLFDKESYLTSSSAWSAGVFVVLFNVTYVASDGRLVLTDYSLTSQHPSSFILYKNGTWLLTPFSKFIVSPFICQKHHDYLGCYQNVIDASLPTFNSPINSLTTCLQWCQGRMYSYAAVSGSVCQCLNDTTSLVQAYGLCSTPCSLMKTQSCGRPGVASTVVRIAHETGVVKDCRALFNFGVIEPGIYKTRWDMGSPELYITCFDNPHPLAMFSKNASSIVSKESSPVISTAFGLNDVLFSFPLTRTWKPLDNFNSFIQINLMEDYIVTGIVLTGRFTAYEQSHVTVYRLSYLDPYLNEWLNYTHHGQSNVSSGCDTTTIVPLCYNFLWHPFVSRSIKIFPLEWKNSVSVKIGLLGQPFSTYNHDEPHIGCCPDFKNTSKIASVGLPDTQVCRDACRDMQLPFASPMDDGTCLCGQDWASNGFLDRNLCPDGGRVGTGNNRAIHRTYEKRCLDPRPALLGGYLKEVANPYHDSIDTYGTILKYECNQVPEPFNTTLSDQIYCTQENEWSKFSITCPEKKHQAAYKMHGSLYRLTTPALAITARSLVDCASRCRQDLRCNGYNFLPQVAKGKGSCRLFHNEAGPSDLVSSSEWLYWKRQGDDN